MTTGMHISAIADLPFFTDPYMSGTWGLGPDDHRSDRAYVDIDLGRGRQAGAYHEKSYYGKDAEMLLAQH